MSSVDVKLRADALDLKIYKIKRRMLRSAILLSRNEAQDGVERFFLSGWDRAHKKYLYKLINC